MNIEGLDYNTQREKLVLPEYGREIQKMVDYAVSLPEKEDRQHCANSIVEIMKRMVPQTTDKKTYEQKMWDHLALMSHFKLDIDWPYDIHEAQHMSTKPEPMGYPMKSIPVRHYGSLVFELFEKLKQMEPGKEMDRLIRDTANQMKRDLVQWSHGSADDEKVISDLATYTDGKVQLDPESFKISKHITKEGEPGRKKKKH